MNRLFATLLAAAPVFAFAEVQYTLTPDPVAKSVRVSMSVDSDRDQVAFRIPAWSPGFYVILNYEKKLSGLRAVDGAGKPLQVMTGIDTRQWVVRNPAKGKITLSYSVLGDDPALGFFGVSVLPHTAFVHGPAAFMFVDDLLREPVKLTIKNPAGWDVGTSLDKAADGTFRARDYDELVDHPIRVGLFQRRTFNVMGVPFEAIFTSPDQVYQPDLDAEAAIFKALSLPAMQMFGGAPFKKYVYHVHLSVGNFGGGLEHQASTVLAIPNKRPLDINELTTHEFFHVWDVKHIRPKVLGPFDYTKEIRTDNLWFSEGVDDYYGKITAYRSGVQNTDQLFRGLASEIRTLTNSKTRLKKTLAEASRGAWEGGSQGTGDLSYYNKGQLVGLLLDAAIRKHTRGAKSLDDVMRYMFARHRLPDKPGFEEDGILRAVNAVSGTDMSVLYNKMVYTTEELPYDVLAGIGMRAILPNHEYAAFGFQLQNGVVSEATDAVEEQGLSVGDKVIAINGKPFAPMMRGFTMDGYTVQVRRGEEPIRLKLKPVVIKGQNFGFERDPFASAEAAALGDGWLLRTQGVK